MWEYGDRRQAQQIVANLWLGPYVAAKDANFMGKMTHVLIVASESETKFLKPWFADRLVYKTLVLEESPFAPIFPALGEGIQWLHGVIKEGGRVFVHGNSGMNRSAAVAIAYLIGCENLTFEEAQRHVQEVRQCLSLSDSLRGQLRAFEPYVRAFQQSVSATTSTRKRGHDDITPEPTELFFEDK